MILALYGNFRQGEPLSHYLERLFERGEVKTTTLKGLKMYALGQAPGIKITNNESDEVVVELLKVDLSPREENWWLLLLDKVEGVQNGLYERRAVATELGTAYIYVCNFPTKGAPVIRDWIEWKNSPIEEKIKSFKNVSKNAVLIGLRS